MFLLLLLSIILYRTGNSFDISAWFQYSIPIWWPLIKPSMWMLKYNTYSCLDAYALAVGEENWRGGCCYQCSRAWYTVVDWLVHSAGCGSAVYSRHAHCKCHRGCQAIGAGCSHCSWSSSDGRGMRPAWKCWSHSRWDLFASDICGSSGAARRSLWASADWSRRTDLAYFRRIVNKVVT